MQFPPASGSTQMQVQKLPTGIEGFDDVCQGGLPIGRSTLISGTSGTGKTVFSLHFLHNGVKHFDEPGIFVTFEESPLDILRNAASFGWNLQEMVDAPASPRAVKKLATLQNDDSPTKRDGYGKVPLYLQERKSELAEIAAKKKRDEDNKKAPRGMTLMPEEERLDTLRILKDNLKATKDNLGLNHLFLH